MDNNFVSRFRSEPLGRLLNNLGENDDLQKENIILVVKSFFFLVDNFVLFIKNVIQLEENFILLADNLVS